MVMKMAMMAKSLVARVTRMEGQVLDIWGSTEDYWGPLGRANCTLGDMALMMVIGDDKRDDDSGGNILVARDAQ